MEVDNVAEDLRRIVNEGPGVGIVTVAGAVRPSALGSRYGAALSQRFLFRLADPADFGVIGVRPRSLPAFVPGRFMEGGAQLVGQVPAADVSWVDRPAGDTPAGGPRSEERRVGKECVSPCRSRWLPDT